jgi:hypothetical protein
MRLLCLFKVETYDVQSQEGYIGYFTSAGNSIEEAQSILVASQEYRDIKMTTGPTASIKVTPVNFMKLEETIQFSNDQFLSCLIDEAYN